MEFNLIMHLKIKMLIMRFLILIVLVFSTINVVFATTDTTYHYFQDGRLSVKIAPEVDRQKILVYHISGELIYELENVRLSYTVSNELYFRSNGSLEYVKTFTNPGASRYMYNAEIKFRDDNQPVSMQNFKFPADTMLESMGEKFLWSEKEKRWIKQEVIACFPPLE